MHDAPIRRNPTENACPPAQTIRGFVAAALLVLCFSATISPAGAQTLSAQETQSMRADALFTQAKALHDAEGSAQDLTAARELYREAADLGSTYACINLGYMYFTGEGAPQDFQTSLLWYGTAADNGNRDAQRMMSVFYKNGLGVDADPAKAKLWTDRAAEGWNKYARPKPEPEKTEIETQTTAPPVSKTVISTPVIKTALPPALTAIIKPEHGPEPDATKEFEGPALTPSVTTAKPATAKALTPKAVAAPPSKAKSKPGRAALWLALLSGVTLAMFGAISILTARYRAVKSVRDKRQFTRAFYAHHRNILRSSYMTAQDHKGVLTGDKNDPWIQAALNLMVRFAQKHEIVTGNPMQMTAEIIRIYKTDPDGAHDLLMPLMPAVEDVLLEDLEGHFTPNPPKASARQLWAAVLQRHNSDLPGDMSATQ